MTYSPEHPREPQDVWIAVDGTALVIRPIDPDDAAREQAFVRELSPHSRRLRFMGALRELSPAQLARFTHIDVAREFALVALQRDADGNEVQVGVARFATRADARSCEFGIVIADAWQGRGLGRHLMTRLIRAAAGRGLQRMSGEVLADNHAMLALARSLGFTVEAAAGDPSLRHVVLLLDARPQ